MTLRIEPLSWSSAVDGTEVRFSFDPAQRAMAAAVVIDGELHRAMVSGHPLVSNERIMAAGRVRLLEHMKELIAEVRSDAV